VQENGFFKGGGFLHQYPAKVKRVIDGDTIVIDLQAHVLGIGFVVQDVYLRLLGVDTPEIKGDSKEQGLMVKQFVEDLILGEMVVVESEERDSFGRWLSYVYYQDYNLSELLLDIGYAKPY
jgi:micrococcal nuclease